jgi:hypothetical protein
MAAFTKGDSRINRKGRPRKGASLTEALEKELKKRRSDGETTNKAELARVLVSLALDGKDLSAIRYVFDRVEGRPRESVDANLTGSMDISIGSPPDLEEAEFPE